LIDEVVVAVDVAEEAVEKVEEEDGEEDEEGAEEEAAEDENMIAATKHQPRIKLKCFWKKVSSI